MRIIQFARMNRRSLAFQIGWRCAAHDVKLADAARDHRLVGDFPAAYDAIDVLGNDVHRPVADAQFELDVGVARIKIGQRRNDHRQPER